MQTNQVADNVTEQIVFSNVSLQLDEDTGVFNVDLSIKEAMIMVLIGPSGSGKSTLLRLLLGLSTPDEGSIAVFGQPPKSLTAKQRARLAYIPQSFVLYPELSVIENIRFASAMYGARPKNRDAHIDEALDVVELDHVRKRLARDLSGGMQRRLQFAAAVVSPFDVLVADEATAGIDPILRQQIWSYLHSLRDDGKTVILTTQYIAEAEQGDTIAILKEGHIIASGTGESIRAKIMPNAIVELELSEDTVLKGISLLEEQIYVERTYRLPDRSDVVFAQIHDEPAPLEKISSLFQETAIDAKNIGMHETPFTEIFRRALENSQQ